MGIMSSDPTAEIGAGYGGAGGAAGVGGAGGIGGVGRNDIGPVGPINKQAAYLDTNTTKLYNNLAAGLVQAKMEYRFVHHLRRNDTLNSGYVSEKMILSAISMTYKES